MSSPTIMEYKTFKTEAIIIKEKAFSERDKIFTVFTKNYGKIEILAKSIRKIKAKLKAGLQLLNYLSLEFVKGKNFNIATDAIIKNEFLNLKKSTQKFRSSLYVCDLLDKLVRGEEKDEKIWNLILETLNDIDLLLINNGYWLPLRFFEWNLASLLGFKPELYSCANCQEKIKREGKYYFSAKDGGLVCQKCHKKSRALKKNDIEISKDTIKILRLIISRDKKILKKIRIILSLEKELKKLSKCYLEHILEEEILVLQ